MVKFKDIKEGDFFFWGGKQLIKMVETSCLSCSYEPRRNAVLIGVGTLHYFKPDEYIKIIGEY